MNGIEGVTLRLMASGLDAAAARHRVISANIANANNPDHVPLRAEFATVLAAAAKTLVGDSAGASAPEPRIELNVTALPGNPVQVDAEMVELAHNTLYYQAVAQGVGKHFALYSVALNEGR